MSGPRRDLAARRRSRGFTQEALAYAVGVDRSTVVRWEAGETEPQPWLRRKLMRSLAVSPDELESLLDRRTAASARRPSTGDPAIGRAGDLEQLLASLDAIDGAYETAPSASLLAETGRCHAALTMLLSNGGLAGGVEGLHGLATRSAMLLSQLVWDASGRRDTQTALRYCTAAVEHAEACNDVLAEAQVELRRTYIELYSVGRRPDLAAALALAESTRDKSRPISKALCGVAELHVAEALALAGEYRRCEQALARAEACFEQQPDDDPAIEMYAPSQLGRLAGSCYLFLGAPERAEPLLVRTAEELADRPKTRALVLGNVALSHLRQRELDMACGRLHEAIDLLEEEAVVAAACRWCSPPVGSCTPGAASSWSRMSTTAC